VCRQRWNRWRVVCILGAIFLIYNANGLTVCAGEQSRLQVIDEGRGGEDIPNAREVVGEVEQWLQFIPLALWERPAPAI
jgi:hypothetical protein